MEKVVVGIIGSGFAAHLHLTAYQFIYGVDVDVKAISSLSSDLKEVADQYHIRETYLDYNEMLKDQEIDVIDIIVPPMIHAQCIRDAMNAGKHVICEKPLTGYFGEEGDKEPIGLYVNREKMKNTVTLEMDELKEFVKNSGKKFMYAENWVYVPSVLKSAEIITAKKSKQLFIKAEESHSGSHALHAAQWKMTGGGSLIRQGCHPLSAVLYLKSIEAAARNERIELDSVICDTGNTALKLPEEEKRYIKSRPIDVEDWACANYTFTDGTKAVIISEDIVLGGVKNYIEIYGNDAVLLNNISPNNALESYFTDEENLKEIYLTEKAQTKIGWQSIFLDELRSRGYIGEIQDFMECVAFDRKPLAGIDLAYQTTLAIYAAYQSSSENRRINFRNK